MAKASSESPSYIARRPNSIHLNKDSTATLDNDARGLMLVPEQSSEEQIDESHWINAELFESQNERL
jgi:hypothetical protein